MSPQAFSLFSDVRRNGVKFVLSNLLITLLKLPFVLNVTLITRDQTTVIKRETEHYSWTGWTFYFLVFLCLAGSWRQCSDSMDTGYIGFTSITYIHNKLIAKQWRIAYRQKKKHCWSQWMMSFQRTQF